MLAIVMPAYNEAGCIEAVVRRWYNAASSLTMGDFSLFVVNDGSKDDTGQILDRLARELPCLRVTHQPNGGHGVALLRAYHESLKVSPQWVFHVDSDDQFDDSDLNKMWELRFSSEFLLGFRQTRHDAFHRLVITRVVRFLNLMLFGRYIPDANVPFRLIQGHYLANLLQKIPAGVFAPNIFLSVLATMEGRDVKSIPVAHKERKTGTVSILRWRLLKVCLRSAGELLRFRMQSILKR